MKIEARQIQIPQRDGAIERIKPSRASILQFRRNARRFPS
jgi:hypothetical protein